MDEENKTKRKPALIIVALIFCIIHFLTFVYCIVSLSIHTFSEINIFVSPIVAIVSLVFAIICLEENKKVLKFTILIANIIFLVIGSFFYVIGTFQLGIREAKNDRNEYVRETAIKYSDVEFVKTVMPDTDMPIWNEDNVMTSFYCYDVTGELVKKFKSIEFTLTEYEELPELNPISFYSDYYCRVVFFKDYSGLKVESHVSQDGLVFGPISYSYTNTYSLDVNEGIKLRDMLNETIASQVIDYQELEEEIKNSISLETSISEMDEEGVNLSLDYRKEKDNNEIDIYQEYDFNRKVLETLKQFDFSKVTIFEGEFESFKNGIVYKNLKQDNNYIISYNDDNKTMKIEKYYYDMFNYNRKTFAVFKVDDDDGTRLMLAAKEVMIDSGWNDI